jgi:hypothetical protein
MMLKTTSIGILSAGDCILTEVTAQDALELVGMGPKSTSFSGDLVSESKAQARLENGHGYFT